MMNSTLEYNRDRVKSILAELRRPTGASRTPYTSLVRLDNGDIGEVQSAAPVMIGDYMLIQVRDDFGSFISAGIVETVFLCSNQEEIYN